MRARAIARERLLGAARFGPSREARSRVFRDGDHGRAAGGAAPRPPLDPLSTLSVRLPRPMRARARTHRSPPARLASSRFGSVLARVFSDLSPLDADAGSPPSLLCPGVQVVRRERERAVHVVAFESPREWPSHLRRGRLRRRRREPGGPRAGSSASNRPATVPASSALGCKSVGLIFARPEQVFNLVMDLGPERASWDPRRARRGRRAPSRTPSTWSRCNSSTGSSAPSERRRRDARRRPSSPCRRGLLVRGAASQPVRTNQSSRASSPSTRCLRTGLSFGADAAPDRHRRSAPARSRLDAEFTRPGDARDENAEPFSLHIVTSVITGVVATTVAAASSTDQVAGHGARRRCVDGDCGRSSRARARPVSLSGGQRPSDQPEESTEDEDEDVFEDASSEASDDDLSDAGDADVLADEAGAGSRDRPGDAPGANTSRRASVDSTGGGSNRRSSLGTRGSDPRVDRGTRAREFDGVRSRGPPTCSPPVCSGVRSRRAGGRSRTGGNPPTRGARRTGIRQRVPRPGRELPSRPQETERRDDLGVAEARFGTSPDQNFPNDDGVPEAHLGR